MIKDARNWPLVAFWTCTGLLIAAWVLFCRFWLHFSWDSIIIGTLIGSLIGVLLGHFIGWLVPHE